jgi:hypothetical protein
MGDDQVAKAKKFFVLSPKSPSDRSTGIRVARVPTTRSLSAVTVVLVGLGSLSCGTSHAILQVSAPATVVAGSPFSVTVTAMFGGKRDTMMDGPIHFTTTDKAAALPTLYQFTAADGGSHTFTDLTLVTPGNQTITVSDYDATPIAGSANITVTSSTD